MAELEPSTELSAALEVERAEAITQGRWPNAATLTVLDLLGNNALEGTLAAVEGLPTDVASLKEFLFGSGGGIANMLLERLGTYLTNPQHPSHQAALAVVTSLAQVGVPEAREVLQERLSEP